MTDRERDELGRFMGLGPNDIAEFFRLISIGHRPGTVAKSFGCTPQAFYMRKARDPEFYASFLKAEAKAEMDGLVKLRESAEAGDKWQADAWFMERRFDWAKAHEKAAVRKLKADAKQGNASEIERQKALRAFVENERLVEAGDPNATPESLSNTQDEEEGEE